MLEDGMHVRTHEADADGNVVEEIAIVTTDIEAPTATAFAMVTGQALNTSTDTTNDDPTVTNEALAVDGTSADVRALVMSSAFASPVQAQLTFPNDNTATDDMDEAAEVAGTYNGAMGTYRCNGGAVCTVDINAMGMITAMSDGWVFTPDEGATSDVPDADYLHYGFWLKRTTGEDGAVTYNEVETFAGSSIAATGGVTQVTGSASYAGGATGVFVKKNAYDPGTGVLIDATSGHFTAMANLSATFGQVEVNNVGTIAPNLLNTLTGTIDNFVLSTEEENDWEVNLMGTITPGDGTATGTANSDGTFNATFHGSVAADTEGNIPKPSAVVGEFNAGVTGGVVAGGFGARLTE